jgi:hypothetical protein
MRYLLVFALSMDVHAAEFIPAITAEAVRPHVNALASPAYRGRSGPDARRAAAYIENHFRSLKLQPLFHGGYRQEIPESAPLEGAVRSAGLNVGACLFFSTGEHPDYHTPRDTPDRLDFDKAARVSSLVLAVVQHVANDPEPPTWTDDVQHGLDEPKALVRITTLLLEAGEAYPLSDVQRFMVSTVRNRCRKIVEAGTMTDEDRTWLIRMSQVLLLSVF